jgi:hypothetical protein
MVHAREVQCLLRATAMQSPHASLVRWRRNAANGCTRTCCVPNTQRARCLSSPHWLTLAARTAERARQWDCRNITSHHRTWKWMRLVQPRKRCVFQSAADRLSAAAVRRVHPTHARYVRSPRRSGRRRRGPLLTRGRAGRYVANVMCITRTCIGGLLDSGQAGPGRVSIHNPHR